MPIMKARNTHTKGISKRLYTLKDAAIDLGRPVSGVRTLIWRGRLPYIQEGRKQYIDIRDLDAYVEKGKATKVQIRRMANGQQIQCAVCNPLLVRVSIAL